MRSDFIIALTQLAAERNLPREIVLSAIEAALASAYKRDSVAGGQNISVTLDPGSGDVSVFVVKTVVEDVEDPLLQLTPKEARKIKPDAEIGDVVPTKSLPHSAGRIAAQTAKQVVIQRLREAERELVFQEYENKEGEVFTVTVQKLEPTHVTAELGRAEAILPISEQPPYERYRVGQKVKVLLQSVRRSNRGPELIISRSDTLLVKRLFELEVPEIFNGAVEIVGIAREAGSRSKVAVFAKQDGVDAVGSCVGLRGVRIQNIVNELYGEKIDVVKWTRDPAQFVASALSPSQVMRVDVNEDKSSVVAIVPDRQLSLAIGKDGQNARLAAKLTGLNVDIKSDVEVDTKTPVKAGAAPTAEVAAPAEAAEEAIEAPATELVEAEAPAEAPAVEPAQPSEEPVEPVAAEIPKELLLPEEVPSVPEPAPAGDVGAPIQELPDEIWRVRQPVAAQPGVIRFAEDIAELDRGTGRRRGRQGGGGSSRKTRTTRRR